MSSPRHTLQSFEGSRGGHAAHDSSVLPSDELRRELQANLHAMLEQALQIADTLGLTQVGIDLSMALARIEPVPEATQPIEPASGACSDAATGG